MDGQDPSAGMAEALRLYTIARQDALTMKYTTVASMALLVYDIILTFSDEYELIWCSKFTWYTWMYMVMRYGNLLHMLTIQLLFYAWDNAPLSSCRTLLLLDAWTLLPLIIPLFLTLGLRAYATCGRTSKAKWWLGALCVIVTLAELAGDILWTVQAKVTSTPLPGLPCIYKVTTASPVLGAVLQTGPTAAFDCIMFIIVAWKMHKSYLRDRTNLVKVIFRDSLWYLVLSGETVACMLLFICLRGEHAALQPTLSSEARTMAIIVASRVILNVRRAASNSGVRSSQDSAPPPRIYFISYESEAETPTDTESHRMSDLEFARSTIAGTRGNSSDY
ncbi:hypothetical protein PsYK624_092530 [Phanerochaete sordida]|uniref:DUF6533 domain-containing protein n=1 Tax=Phanerochaete sordida TaxID=48140 RepID=A0A9P3GG72_9APHY|nr:hypothetical protein PsYK624_092530 [Phanerochaete sordida]